nr:regulatory protein RecX [Micromonospora sp. DSM 115978]
VRARSRAELATVLARRGVEPEVAASVLDRLSEVGLIDDKAFAVAVVATGRANRGLARRALAADLRRRGVDEESSAAALAAVAPEDELASARELVSRRLRTVRGQPQQVQVRRLTGMLARKGYPAGLVSRVVAEALADSEDSIEYADDYEMTDVADDGE